MNGLEEEYSEQVEFVYFNATDGAEGQAAFESYGLRGHPSILIVDTDGSVIWRGNGVQPVEIIEQQLEAIPN